MENSKNEVLDEIFCVGLDKDNNKVYLSEDINYKCNPHILIGKNGCGKQVFMKHLVENALDNNETNLIIVDNLLLDINKYKDKIVEINIDNIDLLKINFNEINLFYDNDKLMKVIMKTEMTKKLIKSLSNEPLTCSTLRTITNVCNILYLKEDTNFKDFIDFLFDYKFRLKVIEKVKEIELDNNILQIQLLNALEYISDINEYDKNENVIGTKFIKFTYLYDLLQPTKDSHIFTKILNSKDNLSLCEIINTNKSILLNLESKNFTDSERNFITTFVLENIILCARENSKNKRVNIFIEDINKVKKIQDSINEVLFECRPLNIRFTINIDQVTDINDKLLNTLRAYRTNISILSPTQNLNKLLLLDDIKKLEQYIDELQELQQDINNLNKFECVNVLIKKRYNKIITTKTIAPKI